MEEWMSTLARKVLPELARRHEVTYVTRGEERRGPISRASSAAGDGLT